MYGTLVVPVIIDIRTQSFDLFRNESFFRRLVPTAANLYGRVAPCASELIQAIQRRFMKAQYNTGAKAEGPLRVFYVGSNDFER